MALDLSRLPARSIDRRQAESQDGNRIRRAAVAGSQVSSAWRSIVGALSLDSRAIVEAERIRPWRWALIAVPILFIASVFTEPSQSNDVAPALWEWLAFLAAMGAFLSYIPAARAAGRGRRSGFVLTAPSTLILLLMAVSCPASGHHAWGAWVIGSFGLAFAAAGLHVASLCATRKAASPLS